MTNRSLISSQNSAFRPWNRFFEESQAEVFSYSEIESSIREETPHDELEGRTARVCIAATCDLLATYRAVTPAISYRVPKRCLTNPVSPVYNNNYDNEDHDYILYVDEVLRDAAHDQEYHIIDLLGSGTFGQVVKCLNTTTREIVAVKVIKNQRAYLNQAWVEVNILRMLHRDNPPEATRNVVKLLSHFVFRSHLCLVFELLSINLYEFIKSNNYRGFPITVVQQYFRQLMSALVVLRRSEVIHCDIKPENVLLADGDDTQVKLIDLGSSSQSVDVIYHYVQSRFYRSPEVLLARQPYDYKIDIWSLGCIAGELFLGLPLFPGQHALNMIGRIEEMLGGFPRSFLERCPDASKYFNISRGGLHDKFTLKSSKQYEEENKVTLPEWKRYFEHKTLRDVIMNYPSPVYPPSDHEIALRESFIDLLKGVLQIAPSERWSAEDAIQHPFLNDGPLPDGKPWTPPSRRQRSRFVLHPRWNTHPRQAFRVRHIARTRPSAPRSVEASSFGGFETDFGVFPGDSNSPADPTVVGSQHAASSQGVKSSSDVPGLVTAHSASHDTETHEHDDPNHIDGERETNQRPSLPQVSLMANMGASHDQPDIAFAGNYAVTARCEPGADPHVAPSSALPPSGQFSGGARRRTSSSNRLSSMLGDSQLPPASGSQHLHGTSSFHPERALLASTEGVGAIPSAGSVPSQAVSSFQAHGPPNGSVSTNDADEHRSSQRDPAGIVQPTTTLSPSPLHPSSKKDFNKART